MSRWLPCLVILAVCLEPVVCRAEDDTPSVIGYALQGFGTGAAVGLGTGFLLSRPTWESKDWKTVGLAGGIGALSGMGVGIILGVIDAAATPHGPGVGFYIMRDMNLGVGLGFLAGAVVGVIVWAGSGHGIDVVYGMTYGVLIGAGAGLVLGVIEGVLRLPKHDSAAANTKTGLSFNLGFTSGPGTVPVPSPMLIGRF
jgi:hypothetical protein